MQGLFFYSPHEQFAAEHCKKWGRQIISCHAAHSFSNIWPENNEKKSNEKQTTLPDT